MSEGSEAIELIVKCDCGFEARGTEEKLIPEMQKHGLTAHNMQVTADEVLAMAHPAGG